MKEIFEKNNDLSFKGKIVVSLRELGVNVGTIEQNGTDESIVLHIPEEQNTEVEKIKEEMEKFFDVTMMQSNMFGYNVWIVESNNLE